MNYTIRTNCIICNDVLSTNSLFFKEDKNIPLACYLINIETDDSIFIPYNVYTCTKCKTSQTKYIGDLNIIYKYNHADSTGTIMQNLHKNVYILLEKYISDITNITEIGSSYGVLSNILLNKFEQINKYYIIEPAFMGIKNKKTNYIT
jgi:hypothetical protein